MGTRSALVLLRSQVLQRKAVHPCRVSLNNGLTHTVQVAWCDSQREPMRNGVLKSMSETVTLERRGWVIQAPPNVNLRKNTPSELHVRLIDEPD